MIETPSPASSPLPHELEEAFGEFPAARDLFTSLSPSHQREHVRYILDAKKPETRRRRARKTAESLSG